MKRKIFIKKIVFFCFLFTYLFASEPFQVPLDGKVYLSNLDENFLEKKESEDWVHLVKAWRGKKMAFFMPHFPKQEKIEGGMVFEAFQKNLIYRVKIEPKKESFLEEKRKNALFLRKEGNTESKIYNLFFKDRKEKVIFLEKEIVTLAVLGEGFNEEVKFFESFQEITPKKQG